MASIGDQALGGIGEGITTYLNGLEQDRREQMRQQAMQKMELAKQSFLMDKQREHDTALEQIRANAMAMIDANKQRQFEAQEDREIDTNAEHHTNSLTTVSDGHGGFIPIPTVSPSTKLKIQSLYKVQQYTMRGDQNKARTVMARSMGVPLDDKHIPAIDAAVKKAQETSDEEVGGQIIKGSEFGFERTFKNLIGRVSGDDEGSTAKTPQLKRTITKAGKTVYSLSGQKGTWYDNEQEAISSGQSK